MNNWDKPATRRELLLRLLKIFLITFRVGLFTFGGGMALTMMLQREFVDKQHWLDDETMVDVMAVGRTLPGVVTVNTSLLAGY
ncbi:MAG: chromate transporter, partial [Oscillospiraceae bacterium]|nr:chromate transporter [Oscillospiraceae bacterium]